jgi:hypothetical protein
VRRHFGQPHSETAFRMTRLRIFAALTFLVTLSCGCDCVQIARARVLDATSKQPIDSVKVYKKSRTEQNTLTNDKGDFELHSISGGLTGCPPMTVVLTKFILAKNERKRCRKSLVKDFIPPGCSRC